LFVALCRRYGLRPFRYRRMHRQTIIVKGPRSFLEDVLWAEFRELDAALIAYLSGITERVIREEVHGETGEADEIDEPPRIGR
jgi:fumarylacetoacetate (FAA) hydrolase family protein